MRKFFNVLSSHKLLSVLLLVILGIIVFSITFYSPRSYYGYLKGKSVESISCVYMDKKDGNIYKGEIDSAELDNLNKILKDGKYYQALFQTKGKLTYYHLEIVYSNGKTVEFNDHYISTIRFGGIRKSTLDFNSIIDLIDKNNVTMIYERILP